MKISMNIPKKASVHIVEHYAGNYYGSASFLMDLCASLASPERIILFSHPDIDAGEFADDMKKRFRNMKIKPDAIGRILCVSEDNIEEQLTHQEYGLYPGMEMILITSSNGLSDALKYIFNTSLEVSRWVSIVVSVQCGFRRSFLDILRNEYSIKSCLMNGYLDTFIHEENQKPKSLNDEIAKFEAESVGNAITQTTPIASCQYHLNREVVDTLSL